MGHDPSLDARGGDTAMFEILDRSSSTADGHDHRPFEWVVHIDFRAILGVRGVKKGDRSARSRIHRAVEATGRIVEFLPVGIHISSTIGRHFCPSPNALQEP